MNKVNQTIHYDRTLAYDLLQLRGERTMVSLLEKYVPFAVSRPTVTLMREDLLNFNNDYKVLYEFVAEVLQKPKFTLVDVVNFYHRTAVKP